MQILAWSLIHSLWQISLIILSYFLIKSLFNIKNPSIKYGLGLAALLLSFLSFVFTLFYLSDVPNSLAVDANIGQINTDFIATSASSNGGEVIRTITPFEYYLNLVAPWIVMAWLGGMFYQIIYFGLGFRKIKSYQSADNQLFDSVWLERFAVLKQKMNIKKKVAVFWSNKVNEPLTFGYFKPIILLPISMMTGFSDKDIEAVLLHELAHIKRADYLVNLLQSLIEILFFYHPLIHWLAYEIRENREFCCDDLVLHLGQNRNAYALTLTALQRQKLNDSLPTLALSANGKDANFSKRIKRLFGEEKQAVKGSFFNILALLLLCSSFTLFSISQLNKNKEQEAKKELTGFYLDQHTNNDEVQKVVAKMQEVEAFYDMNYCWNLVDGVKVKSLSGAYFDEKRAIISFDITDLSKTPLKITFSEKQLESFEIVGQTASIPLKSDSLNLRSQIQWGGKAYNWKAGFGANGKWEGEGLAFTEREWLAIFNKPISIKVDGKWYKIKNLKSIVKVPKKGNPASINPINGDYREIRDKNSRMYELLSNVEIGDRFYYEKINIGLEKEIYLVVTIIENKTKEMGFLPPDAIQFKQSDHMFYPNDDYSAGTSTMGFKKLDYISFDPFSKSIKSSQSETAYVVDGYIINENDFFKLNTDNIEKIELKKGVEANLLYGKKNAILISTKK